MKHLLLGLALALPTVDQIRAFQESSKEIPAKYDTDFYRTVFAGKGTGVEGSINTALEKLGAAQRSKAAEEQVNSLKIDYEDSMMPMWDELDKMVSGLDSFFYLAPQPMYNAKKEVVQWELLLRSNDGTQDAFFHVFKEMTADQWKAFTSYNVDFAKELVAGKDTHVSINIPIFLLGNEHAEFIEMLINKLTADEHTKRHVVVEITEKGLGGRAPTWNPDFNASAEKLTAAELTLALDDISEAGGANYPLTLAKANELYAHLAEVKLEMMDTALIYDGSFPTIPFFQSKKDNMPAEEKQRIVEAMTGLMNRALEDGKKVVLEWSIRDTMTEEQMSVFRSNPNLIIQGDETTSFALRKPQFESLYQVAAHRKF